MGNSLLAEAVHASVWANPFKIRFQMVQNGLLSVSPDGIIS